MTASHSDRNLLWRHGNVTSRVHAGDARVHLLVDRDQAVLSQRQPKILGQLAARAERRMDQNGIARDLVAVMANQGL